jgi:cupin fold WbuC family metalloprotein
MKLEACSDNVFRSRESPLLLDASAFPVLVRAAEQSPLRRARVCMHVDEDAAVQEMLIVLMRGVYIQPHKHLERPESFHVIRGSVGVAFYDDAGTTTRRVTLSAASERLPYYYRLEEAVFHSQVVLTDYVVFHECTCGPFRRTNTIVAPWSPAEHTPEAVQFVTSLELTFRQPPASG